jgi:hypothetical protein
MLVTVASEKGEEMWELSKPKTALKVRSIQKIRAHYKQDQTYNEMSNIRIMRNSQVLKTLEYYI